MSGRRVVLNADDFGYDPAVSLGIERVMREGLVSSTTMMVNTPHSQHAAERAEGLSIGLHLNLARWRSLARPGLEFDATDAGTFDATFVADETRAQLEHLQRLLGRPATHLDVHKHLHRHPTVLTGIIDAVATSGLPVRSIDEPMRARLATAGVPTNDAFFGDAGTDAFWTLPRFEEALTRLPAEGLVELMCHPGQAPTQVKSGYRAQREVELATFLSVEARRAAERAGVRFEGWR